MIAELRGRRAPAGAGRRLGALHPRDPGPLRVPRHRPRRPAPARGRARRAWVRPPCTPGCASVDPDAAERILAENGRRTVRALEVIELTGRPYTALAPDAGVRRPAHRPDRRRHRPADPRRPDRAARRRDVRGRVRRRGRAAARRGAGRGAHRRPARSATREVPAYLAGELTLDEARERTVVRDPAVRPPPGRVVPQGSADHLAAATTTPTWSRRR